ncbi:hypothetical protein F441_10305 [Phytophthora nicotianae CJ01A1]|uniref:RxLR effector protein n=1 Tax=Phytophthora nicotianae CJ01A1 TaxID=1317063 RepID=W2WXA2_PHYNI|nr:hypothetical protein F441_10305 [Phytophthora nicotianae CJ01A1]
MVDVNTDLHTMPPATTDPSFTPSETDTKSKRLLRGFDTSSTDTGKFYYYPPRKGNRRPFIEVRLKEALTNPKITRRLYEVWSKRGFTSDKLLQLWARFKPEISTKFIRSSRKVMQSPELIDRMKLLD